MSVIVEAVEVQDGTMPPSRDAVLAAEESSKNDKLRPQDTGYSHAVGEARTVHRYVWRSTISGKSSGRCTFPNEGAAKIAGDKHEKMTRSR